MNPCALPLTAICLALLTRGRRGALGLRGRRGHRRRRGGRSGELRRRRPRPPRRRRPAAQRTPAFSPGTLPTAERRARRPGARTAARSCWSSTPPRSAASPRSSSGLEALYRERRGDGFVILGFPADDVVGQEPRSNEEIAEFCKANFGVTFPMFAKSNVVDDPVNPLFVDARRRARRADLQLQQVPARPPRQARRALRPDHRAGRSRAEPGDRRPALGQLASLERLADDGLRLAATSSRRRTGVA